MLLSAYAYAVSEISASGEEVVTAPTCGSSGVLPATLYYAYHDLHLPFEKVKDSLYTAGIFGNLVKQNASIAGAIGGCQAEIGTASSMAAAAFVRIKWLYRFIRSNMPPNARWSISWAYPATRLMATLSFLALNAMAWGLYGPLIPIFMRVTSRHYGKTKSVSMMWWKR
jgi:hypothetical protein